jgi:hypothetical protein
MEKRAKPQSGRPIISPSISLLEMIDKLLLTSVKITRDGESRRVAVLKVILEQLWNKAIAGDRRARAVFLRWLELAPQVTDRTVEITFADSDYTRTFTGQSSREPRR